MKPSVPLSALLVVLFCGSPSGAMQRHVPFADVVRSASLVFVGTVADRQYRPVAEGRSVFTDVTFTEVEVVAADPAYPLPESDTLTLGFAGGELDGKTYAFSGVPRLEPGKRYVLCIHGGDAVYAAPTVGGVQGVFPVLRDEESGAPVPTTYGGRGIVGVDGRGELETTPPVARVRSAIATYRTADTSLRFVETMPVAAPGSPSPNAKVAVSRSRLEQQAPARVLTLEELAARIRDARAEKGGAR